MKKKNLVVAGLLFLALLTQAQHAIVHGIVTDSRTRLPIPFATVVVQGTNRGTVTDSAGRFTFDNLKAGYVNLETSFLGYEKKLLFELEVFNNKPVQVQISLDESSVELESVVVKPKLFDKPAEIPNSMKSLGVTEIKRAPGSGQDISRVIQTLPGVASTPASNRNDIIVRGGGPTENSFFVDDFEVTAINHFTTQGASGGVWGIVDANHLEQFNLHAGAFPLYADNVLSSVFNLELKNGNSENFETQLNLGTMQRGINANGPMGEKTTFLVGVRQANFDLLFASRPVIPKFTDAIAKVNVTINQKNSIEFFTVTAIDNLDYNTGADSTDENLYILERVRKIDQNMVTAGTKWIHYWKNGNSKLIYSFNNLNNTVTKYRDNDESKEQVLDYRSTETLQRFDIRNTLFLGPVKVNFGAHFKNAGYDVKNRSFQVSASGVRQVDFSNYLTVNHFGLYAQAGQKFFNDALDISLGFRMDGNSYSSEFSNPFKQFLPRLNVSYHISNQLSVNASAGRYFQAPSMTSLGYIEDSILINKQNGIKPVENRQFVAGFEYNTPFNAAFTAEAFYKEYLKYPLSVEDNISLANKGAGFGVYGDEALVSVSNGHSYGIELFYQQKLFKGFYGMMAYTWVKSEFTDNVNHFIASSWDYRHIISTTLGKQFKNNWELGAKWVYYGGIPYTPYNEQASALKENWDLKNQGILDYSKLNSQRTNAYHQLDIRVDKKYFFKKWNLNLFADIQNVYNFAGGVAPNLILDRNENHQPQTDPNNAEAYLLKYAEVEGYGLRPNIGCIVQF